VTGYDTVLRARRMVTAAGETSGCVGVTDGRIAAMAPLEAGLEGRRVVELGDDVALLPGLVDTHVHVDEPGRTEWEGFATATRAAGAGGVTTIIDMPLNSIPPTVDPAALETKRKSAEGQCFVDVGFWGGAVPGNLGELRSLHDAGVFGFKCFLLHSGVDEFPPLHPANLDAYLATLGAFDGLMIVHAEDSTAIDRAPSAHGQHYRDFLASRPRTAENLAVAKFRERFVDLRQRCAVGHDRADLCRRGESFPRGLRVHPLIEIGKSIVTEATADSECETCVRTNQGLDTRERRFSQDLADDL